MEVKITVKEHRNWDKMTDPEYLSCLMEEREFGINRMALGVPKKLYIENIRKWGRSLTTGFVEYRKVLMDIALFNWKKTGCEISYNERDFSREDLIYIPTDDDDWMYPKIAEYISPYFEKNPNLKIMCWDWYVYRLINNKDKYVWMPCDSICLCSASYAIRASCCKQVYIHKHAKVDKMLKGFIKNGQKDKYLLTEDPLRIVVKHPASHRRLSNFELIDAFFDKFPLTKTEIPEELSWAKEETEMVFNATNEAMRSRL